LGQSHAQKLLTSLLEEIPKICERVFTIKSGDIGVSIPGLAMASAQHERQYSRLFRS
jgi:urease accessory protein